MFIKEIKYTDYNGEERKEKFMFNLTKSELIELELSLDGGISDYINKIVETRDNVKMIALFKELILKAYGEKTANGKGFMKSKEAANEFAHSAAYDALFVELLTVEDAAKKFVEAIVPTAEQAPVAIG